MVATSLVDRDIKDGETLIRQLDRDRFPVIAAFWFYYSEWEKWALVIGTSLIDKEGPLEAYRRLAKIMKKIKQSSKKQFTLESSRVELVKEKSHLPISLRKVINTGPGIAGIRFTNNSINGTYVEDAYIYRVN